MKKTFLILFFATCLFMGVKAQHSYTFSKTTGHTYADLSGDISVPAFDPTLQLFFINDFQGETFKFFDLDFTFGGIKTISIGTGAFLRIDNDSSLIIVDAAFTYIDTIDATTKISYLVQGTANNRVLKVQYKNFKLRYGQASNFINVQICYYQATGIIDIQYGPRSANNASGFTTQSGPNIGIFYSPDDFTGCYEKLWCNGSPANVTLDSAATLVFHAMTGMPDEGTVYRFTPRFMHTTTVTALPQTTPDFQFNVFPNPAGEKIRVEGLTHAGKISLYSLDGKLIKEAVLTSVDPPELPVSELPAGLYLVRVETKNGIASRKIAVMH